ncbi:DUF58 domain-containing protein [Mariniblastus fucicola]|uniref:DUF58 domain-containing protein n=1 Tax=Mariniblastus fucicola TaxID=980251 RepID=A0A5B9PE02_9BACT|nr:DUF58 domain-containing protein [Mariniblastus fucicola]QEG21173.1 hypothetical protein MFFC18_10270 [Mariniblastus fucicola]
MLEVVSTIFQFLVQRPLIMLLLMAAPFLLAVRTRSVFPTRLMLGIFSCLAGSSLLIAVGPGLITYLLGFSSPLVARILIAVVVALDVLLLLVAFADFFTVVSASKLSASRSMLRIASLGKPHDVEIELVNKSTYRVKVSVKDDLPGSFKATPANFDTVVEPLSRAVFDYRIVSDMRGKYSMDCVYVEVRSFAGLWKGLYKLPAESMLYVYPDMRQIAEYDLLARTNRLSLVGVRRTRKIGQDNEFERLRDYTADDNYKNIDWRSTAKRRKLTVKDFQTSQSQRIIFMLDCGRLMTGMSGRFDMLDHALNAILMLSYVALKQGDAVGLICFSDKVHSFTPPRTGLRHINHLLNATFDQKASYVESRFDDAFFYLQRNCPKRSLVVLVSNVLDEVNANQVLQFSSQLTGRHLPLCVFARDHDLYQMVDKYSDQVDAGGASDKTLYEAAASASILSWRKQVITDLQHQGVLAIESFPEDMTAQLVNQYLEIKARHLL